MVSDHNRINLDMGNREMAWKIYKYLESKQHTIK